MPVGAKCVCDGFLARAGAEPAELTITPEAMQQDFDEI